jgi:protein RecA
MVINVKGKGAVTPKAQAPKGNGIKLDQVISQIEKDDKKAAKGADIASTVMAGDQHASNVPRIPTGVFGFDYQTGGGFPRGKISVIFGPESSNKTVLLYKAINEAQKEPGTFQIFVDIENAFDPSWAGRFIKDLSRVIVVRCDNAEEYIDKAELLIMAEEVNFMGIDSLAMMTPSNELDSSAEKASVGGAANLITKMLRKLNARLSDLSRVGQRPAVVCINQIRMKIGVMMGNPEDMPGGKAIKYMSSLTVRVSGKNEADGKDSLIEEWKLIGCIIKKHKIPVICKKVDFYIRMRPFIDSDGVIVEDVGFVNDLPNVFSLAKSMGLFAKNEVTGKGYTLRVKNAKDPSKYDTMDFLKQDEFKKQCMDDRDFYLRVQSTIIDLAHAQAGV